MIRPRFDEPRLEDRGEHGNIAVMTAICTSQMRRFGASKGEIEALRIGVKVSTSYEAACNVLRTWFPLSTDLVPKPTRLKDRLYDKWSRTVGYYVNPSDGSEKEDWLAKNANSITLLEAKEFEFGKGNLPVCLVDNGAFTAAAIAYCPEERDMFLNTTRDTRPKAWFSVKKDLLKEWYNRD